MAIEEHVYMGRRKLFTEFLPTKMRRETDTSPLLDEESIPTIIKDVWGDVLSNGVESTYLLDYYKGRQDILDRVKVVRPDVDNRVPFNHAMAITRDTVGYTFGKPIRYVHRNGEVRKGVAELNKLTEAEDKFSSDQELALYASICGTAYRGIFADAYGIEDEIPFSIMTLDPTSTFIVYSSEIGNPPVLACTFYETPPSLTYTNKFVYLIYTHDYIYRYEVTSQAFGILDSTHLVDKSLNILGEIPIVEYPNNVFRIGDWEMVKNLLDAINLVGSDSVNDLEQFVNSILVAVNVELDENAKASIKDDKIVSIRSDKELPAELKYISEQLDVGSAQELRDYLNAQMGIIVGIPSRGQRSGGGGDTGDAVYLRDGFQDLEIVARNKETSYKRAERASLKLILNLLQKQGCSAEIMKLTTKDIDIRFSRNMTDGILAKSSAISTLISTKTLDPVDVLSLVDISTEPDELALRGKTYWDKVNAEVMANQKTILEATAKATPVDPKNTALKQKTDRK